MTKVAVFSDVHGNRPALERFISNIKDIGATTSIFLGDAIGYIPDPTVLDLLLSIETLEVCILGNHEQKYFTNESNSRFENNVYEYYLYLYIYKYLLLQICYHHFLPDNIYNTPYFLRNSYKS
jgi:hypothetical protein